MFDFGSMIQPLMAGIGDLFVNEILRLISGLLGGLPG